jgi:hypothetical protein
VNRVARLGEHIEVLQKPLLKLRPVAANAWSFGVSSRCQPGSSGQWQG